MNRPPVSDFIFLLWILFFTCGHYFSPTSGAVGVNESGDQLDMRRPDELVDRLNGGEAVAAGDEDAGVAREARRIARDGGEAFDAGAGERGGLRLGADARRVEDDRVTGGELVGLERPALQIACLRRHPRGESGAPRRLGDRGDRRGPAP